MQPTIPAFGRLAAAAAALLIAAGDARAQRMGDHVDITAVTVQARGAEECNQRSARVSQHARALSLATSPPYDLSDGLRTFYDHVLRLDLDGELSSTAQLSTAYVAGYTSAGEPVLRAVAPFIRVEVARPAGTPTDAPSRIALSWLWLQRLAERNDPAGRMVQHPQLHRFDFTGDLVTTYGTWGVAIAPCQPGAESQWFGAVAVWTYLPP